MTTLTASAVAALLLLLISPLSAAEPTVTPTFLRRNLSSVPEQPGAMTSPGCHVKPVFGEGTPEARIARGVARFAHIALDAGGSCVSLRPEREEQVAVVIAGEGVLSSAGTRTTLKAHDFMYLPAGVEYKLSGVSGNSLSAILIGFRLPAGVSVEPTSKPLIANYDEVKLQQVGNHPPSTLYRLMMGDRKSTRDRISSAHVLTSLFLMEFAPGGTNIPHHHDREEEIYLVLQGRGEMVAGGGVTGVENRLPVSKDDAFFFRLNCTVGFYSAQDPENKAIILAVRSLYPFSR
jgi:mannose-6-phosphate isomerase-like protein (cupin superfamily)